MSQREPIDALACLGGGLMGGLLGSLVPCFCWALPGLTAFGATRWAHRRGSRRSGGALGLGAGLVSGLVVGSLGSLLFLAGLDPGELEEGMAVASAMQGGADVDIGLGGIAAAHGAFGFGVSLFFGLFGGVLGSRSSSDAGPRARATPSAARAEWTPRAAAGTPPPPRASAAGQPTLVTRAPQEPSAPVVASGRSDLGTEDAAVEGMAAAEGLAPVDEQPAGADRDAPDDEPPTARSEADVWGDEEG